MIRSEVTKEHQRANNYHVVISEADQLSTVLLCPTRETSEIFLVYFAPLIQSLVAHVVNMLRSIYCKMNGTLVFGYVAVPTVSGMLVGYNG